MTQQGFIVRWDATRALGFIRSGDCAGDVFFHLHACKGAAYNTRSSDSRRIPRQPRGSTPGQSALACHRRFPGLWP